MSQSFLHRLKNYLDERLKNEVFYGFSFKPFEIDIQGLSSRWRWDVRSEAPALVRFIIEDTDGTIVVESFGTDEAGEYIGECLVKNYRLKLRMARLKGSKEEEVWEAIRREEKEAREYYLNRRNLEKHLKNPIGIHS